MDIRCVLGCTSALAASPLLAAARSSIVDSLSRERARGYGATVAQPSSLNETLEHTFNKKDVVVQLIVLPLVLEMMIMLMMTVMAAGTMGQLKLSTRLQ